MKLFTPKNGGSGQEERSSRTFYFSAINSVNSGMAIQVDYFSDIIRMAGIMNDSLPFLLSAANC